MAKEMKTLNGYEVVDAKARERVSQLSKETADAKNDLSNISEVIVSPNIYDETECTNGYMDTSGNVHTSETLKYTTKIPVNTGDVIRSYRLVDGSLQPYPMAVVTGFLSTTGNASSYHSATNVASFTVIGATNNVVISVGEQIVEITINEEPLEYTPKFEPYRVIKDSALPKASETDFGVAKMWVTVDEDGNKVLNISTGDENE